MLVRLQVFWPVLLTGMVHLSSALSIRSAKYKSPPFLVMPYDGALLRSNVAVYLVFIVCWTPLIAASAIGISRELPLRLYNQLEWLAMAKSCLNPFVYAVCNKHFREAFVSLFTYCCCKTSVSFSRRVRGPTLTLAHSYSWPSHRCGCLIKAPARGFTRSSGWAHLHRPLAVVRL